MTTYYKQDNLIKAATLVKHLSVPIDEHLSFSEYLITACPEGKTVKVPCILTENIKSCPLKLKVHNYYKIMVMPIMEYV